jgi:hypothetical protein
VQSVIRLWLVIGISSLLALALGVQIVGVFFYWPELRSPLTWLVGLGLVVVLNSTNGLLALLFSKIDDTRHANSDFGR